MDTGFIKITVEISCPGSKPGSFNNQQPSSKPQTRLNRRVKGQLDCIVVQNLILLHEFVRFSYEKLQQLISPYSKGLTFFNLPSPFSIISPFCISSVYKIVHLFSKEVAIIRLSQYESLYLSIIPKDDSTVALDIGKIFLPGNDEMNSFIRSVFKGGFSFFNAAEQNSLST